jgi:hypothetical protein
MSFARRYLGRVSDTPTIVVRPVFWQRTRDQASLVQLLDVARFPETDGPRRSLCGNGVKRGELMEPWGEHLRETSLCTRCRQILARGDVVYVLEDGQQVLDGTGWINTAGPATRESALVALLGGEMSEVSALAALLEGPAFELASPPSPLAFR